MTGSRLILDSPNRFKLAAFAFNVKGGLLMSDAEGLPSGSWEENARIAVAAERAGFEALVPLARWRGHGGRINPANTCFETFTWAAGLASLTERINIFSTFHVPTVHPIMAAKMGATIDHISDGRFGLNIVAGWVPEELAMFGLAKRDHDERYEVANEWTDLVVELWSRKGVFDFDGRFFQAPGAFSEPKPLQKRPILMSAGASPAGREFAARHSDMIFVAIEDPAKTAATVKEIKRVAREKYDREIQVFGVGHITCRDTEEKAKASYDHVIHEHGDWDAARHTIENMMKHSQTIDYDSVETRRLMEGVIRAFFAYPLTGTPEQIVEMISAQADAGIEGMAITWSDYDEGIEQFRRDLAPLMVEAGLRQEVPAEGGGPAGLGQIGSEAGLAG